MAEFTVSDLRQPSVLIVNFNAPELNQLAVDLSRYGYLHRIVRPYVQQNRSWERLLARMPGTARSFRTSFGRRTLPLVGGYGRLTEVSILADFSAAIVTRLPGLPVTTREAAAQALQEWLRRTAARAAVRWVGGSTHLVAYPGFARRAFDAAGHRGIRKILSYPIAHHRHHLQVRDEEALRVPEFAATWPPLKHFTDEYLACLDEEIAGADRIVVGSEYTRRTFVGQGVNQDRIIVCPYGVDVSLFGGMTPRRTGTFTAVFAGQIGQRKGLSYLLEAYKTFHRPDSELLLIGRWVGVAGLPQRYQRGVRHLSHMPRSELAQTLANGDVFVFPTLLEGMPLTVVEAMAAGLPVIATRNGPDQIVRDGIDGFLVPDRDPAAIAERLERLYADRELRCWMGENAKRRAQEYGWSRFTEQFRTECLN